MDALNIPLFPASRIKRRAKHTAHHAKHISLAIGAGYLLRAFYHFFDPSHPGRPPKEALRCLQEEYRLLIESDLENSERGLYPESIATFPARAILGKLPQILKEAPRLIRRSRRNDFQDLPIGINKEDYPTYYLRNFHWQTDGWFSRRSAELYDPTVELLFGGIADVMRRQVVAELRRLFTGDSEIKAVDLGTGTGKLLHFLGTTFENGSFTGVDLSDAYLSAAAKSLPKNGALVRANAEKTALEDNSADAVTALFLFHELPRDAGRNVVREAARLLKPGGHLVVLDALQDNDRPPLDFFFENFSRAYHEPYLRAYRRLPLERLLEEAGFQVTRSRVVGLSKCVVAKQP